MLYAVLFPGISMGMDRVIKKKKLPLGWILGGGMLFALVCVFAYQLAVVDKKPIQTVKKSEIRISTVKRGDFQEYFQVDCYVAPVRSMYIDSQEHGIVQSVHAEQGNVVTRGEVLIKLQNDELESQLLLKEASLRDEMQDQEGSGIRLQQLETRNKEELLELDHQIQVASDDCTMKKALFDGRAVSQSDLQKAEKELEYLSAKRAILVKSDELDLALLRQQDEKINNSIESTKIDLRRLKERIGSLTVASPAFGQIATFSASVGEIKEAGARIAQLDIMDSMKLKAEMDEFYLPKLAVGSRGSFTYLNTKGEDTECAVSVSWISPDVKNNTFEVDFKFDAAPMNVRIGQRFLVRIELGKKRPAVMLEQGPFFQTSGGRYAYVVDASGGSATKTDIVVGRSNPDYLEVVDGLAPGDKVVVSDYSGFNGLQRISLK